MGIHHNCDAAQSDMLLVREVAMMLIMDRLTDKQNWHVKVFDDDITEKWKTEALAWPEDDLWNRIANLSPYMHEEWQPKRSKTILNRACVDYVSGSLLTSAARPRCKTGLVAKTGTTDIYLHSAS